MLFCFSRKAYTWSPACPRTPVFWTGQKSSQPQTRWHFEGEKLSRMPQPGTRGQGSYRAPLFPQGSHCMP